MNDNESISKQLQYFHDLKNHEDTLTWTIFSIFFAANALLFGAYYQTTDSCMILNKMLLLPLFGIFLSFIWLVVQLRVVKYYLFYEEKVEEIEQNYLKNIEKYHTTRKGKLKKYLHFGIIPILSFWILLLLPYTGLHLHGINKMLWPTVITIIFLTFVLMLIELGILHLFNLMICPSDKS